MPGRNGSKPTYARPKKELAAMVGISPDTLTDNINAGAPKPPKTTRGNLTAWCAKFQAWRKEHIGTFQQQQSRAARSARDEETEEHKRDYQKWRAAEAKLRVARETRQVVSRAEVADFVGKAFLTFKSRLYAMVPKMTSRLENQPSHVVHEEITNEIESILHALSQGLSKANGEAIDE